MIVRKLGGEWLLIEQAEHARHAGAIAEAWASGPLAAGPLRDGLMTAARLHDIGWVRPDSEPEVNVMTGEPLHFTGVRDDRHAAFYADGIRRVTEEDTYAGYLVSLHATGIYSGRFGWSGLQPIAWESVGESGRRFLDEQAESRHRLVARLASTPELVEFEAVSRDYMLLQTFDYLSLFVCAGLESNGCEPVPDGEHGWRALRLGRAGALGAAVDPFPFPDDRLELEVSSRRLRADRFADDAALRRAIATTPMSKCRTWFERA